jgi:hypothetical protein
MDTTSGFLFKEWITILENNKTQSVYDVRRMPSDGKTHMALGQVS